MKPLLLSAMLALAVNANAAGITASVSFDENGRSVTTSSATAPTTWQTGKEPAVEWCEGIQSTGTFNGASYTAWYTKEICGREDGSVFWRKK